MRRRLDINAHRASVGAYAIFGTDQWDVGYDRVGDWSRSYTTSTNGAGNQCTGVDARHTTEKRFSTGNNARKCR